MGNRIPLFSSIMVGSAMLFAGCGVFNVPDDAKRAVADWRERAGETDPCRIDAMEHCVGGSAAAAECGSACAVLLGQLLELRQSDGNAMDLLNNQAGASRCQLPIFTAASLTPNDGDAVGCCEILLNQTPPLLELGGPCN